MSTSVNMSPSENISPSRDRPSPKNITPIPATSSENANFNNIQAKASPSTQPTNHTSQRERLPWPEGKYYYVEPSMKRGEKREPRERPKRHAEAWKPVIDILFPEGWKKYRAPRRPEYYYCDYDAAEKRNYKDYHFAIFQAIEAARERGYMDEGLTLNKILNIVLAMDKDKKANDQTCRCALSNNAQFSKDGSHRWQITKIDVYNSRTAELQNRKSERAAKKNGKEAKEVAGKSKENEYLQSESEAAGGEEGPVQGNRRSIGEEVEQCQEEPLKEIQFLQTYNLLPPKQRRKENTESASPPIASGVASNPAARPTRKRKDGIAEEAERNHDRPAKRKKNWRNASIPISDSASKRDQRSKKQEREKRRWAKFREAQAKQLEKGIGLIEKLILEEFEALKTAAQKLNAYLGAWDEDLELEVFETGEQFAELLVADERLREIKELLRNAWVHASHTLSRSQRASERDQIRELEAQAADLESQVPRWMGEMGLSQARALQEMIRTMPSRIEERARIASLQEDGRWKEPRVVVGSTPVVTNRRAYRLVEHATALLDAPM